MQDFTFNIVIKQDEEPHFLSEPKKHKDLLTFPHKTGESLIKAAKKAIEDSKARVKAIIDIKGERTYENTL